MRMLNLGIVAHVDAGKTSLTERLLFETGAITSIGAVDDGNSHTDTMALEQQRGITIRSAVATFAIGDCEVHLIDTPGHADFIAEVERALGVLDGAILVISAVDGVQAQTRLLMRTLAEMGVPTLLFVNKIDRIGAGGVELTDDIQRILHRSAITLSAVADVGTSEANVSQRPFDSDFRAEITELLADNDDAILHSFLYTPELLTDDSLAAAIRRQTHSGVVHPVFFGSAMTGAGIDFLLNGIREFLPTVDGKETGDITGTVFAVEREHSGAKSALARIFTGSIAARDVVTLSRRGHNGTIFEYSGKITDVRAADGQSRRVCAGDIARITGLREIRVGDRFGSVTHWDTRRRFQPPMLETVVTATDSGDVGSLFAALCDLAEQDPLIDVRRGQRKGSVTISLYGEVQLQVIAARLTNEYDIEAEFGEPHVVCIERVSGTGSAVEEMDDQEPIYFYATVGLRVEPGERGSGVRFQLEAGRGALPGSFIKAIEETVYSTLLEGLRGWQVVDCVVTLTRTGYSSPVSTAGDFRGLTPLVLMAALKQAGTTVCAPFDHVEIELPPGSLSEVFGALARCGGIPEPPMIRGERCLLDAVLPTARLREFSRLLPGKTGGAGSVVSRFDSYREIAGAGPTREQTDK